MRGSLLTIWVEDGSSGLLSCALDSPKDAIKTLFASKAPSGSTHSIYRVQTSINLRQLPRAPHWIASALAIDGAHRRHLDLKVLHTSGEEAVAAGGGVGHVDAGCASGSFAGTALVSVNGGYLFGGPDGARRSKQTFGLNIVLCTQGGRAYWQLLSVHLQDAVSDLVLQVCLDPPIETVVVLPSLTPATSKPALMSFETDHSTVVHDWAKAPMSSWQSPSQPMLPMAWYQSLYEFVVPTRK